MSRACTLPGGRRPPAALRCDARRCIVLCCRSERRLIIRCGQGCGAWRAEREWTGRGRAPSSFTASMAPSFSRRTAERTAVSGDASYDPNGRSPTRSGLHGQTCVSWAALPAAHMSRAVPCITLEGCVAYQAQPASCHDSNISMTLSTAGAQVCWPGGPCRGERPQTLHRVHYALQLA